MNTAFHKSVLRVAILALCTATVSALPAMAQDSPAPQQDQASAHDGGGDHGQRQEHQMQRLTEKLSLTPDQVTQVKAIQDDSRTQMMAVRNDSSVAKPDKRAKMMDIRKASQDKVRALLTDDQKPKYDAMLAKMQEHRHGRQGGDDAPPPPAPQQ